MGAAVVVCVSALRIFSNVTLTFKPASFSALTIIDAISSLEEEDEFIVNRNHDLLQKGGEKQIIRHMQFEGGSGSISGPSFSLTTHVLVAFIMFVRTSFGNEIRGSVARLRLFGACRSEQRSLVA